MRFSRKLVLLAITSLTAIALMAASASPASAAVEVSNGNGVCGTVTGSGTSMDPYTGGCTVSAHSDLSNITTEEGDDVTCEVDITAQVQTDGAIRVNFRDGFDPNPNPLVNPNTEPNCALIVPCFPEDAEWGGTVNSSTSLTFHLCTDTPNVAQVEGDITGVLSEADQTVEFDNALVVGADVIANLTADDDVSGTTDYDLTDSSGTDLEVEDL
jgi:hypothetical protein